MKSLSQFKRYINNGGTVMVSLHNTWQDSIGEIRKPTKVQSNGFYSKAINRDDNCRTNLANGRLGIWSDFGKASDWDFNGTDMATRMFNGEIWYRYLILDIDLADKC